MRQQLMQGASEFICQVGGAVLRVVFATLMIATSVALAMHHMGIPLPTPPDVFHPVEGLSKLARILY